MTISSGILDEVTFVNYNVFATKHTGNVLFLAGYTFSDKPLKAKIERNVAVSLFSFCVGSFTFGRLAHHFSARRRGWPISSTVVQAILVLSAASLQSVTAAGEITSVPALMIVALLAFAASGQSSMAVTVGLAELNTSMVTGAITSTLSDPKTFSAGNATRNRRVIFVASYAAGCILGATMSFGTAASLLVVCAIKLVIGVSFLLNRGKAASRFPAAVSARDEHYNPDTPMLKASWSD